ncbi:hypothetical protein VB834_15635 [Limnoraphis robusta Tam1]|jgi:hypothetical protein|uniref:Rhamnosyl O-methyltransferase n=1 Tax=Limnoraphis robusta CCNP1315 TaxID=3110306 RepID=A0ABU5U3S4_9CYAN|nr:hypothetical protein [Limnoraphis robusta]MEA5500220.1 hypothetical protein [Limnoraphis robusta BA-68 BA1]MEA5521843.1 hypothetical protein [Limnoraphis robusta CCNP1315]MEA5540457.1 hypothetical protein [Limnoraphis robusta Tam1]MEA5543961.1 hypothetical protein [Limnoraphis robusta CCNP1324]
MQKSGKTQEYITRNLRGFEGDFYIEEEIKKLVGKYEIKTIIETGTFLGGTTKRLAQIAEKIYTIEVDSDNVTEAKEFLKDSTNVTIMEGSSPNIIRDLLKLDHGNILFFLDAHSKVYTPLLDELKAIAEAEIKPVIVIHDWKVPNCPEFGYDSYNGQDYTFEWIKPNIEAIYGDNYAYYYNNKAEGGRRGVIYIHSI